MRYEDLTLEVADARLESRDGRCLGSFAVRVLASPAGEMAPGQAVSVEYDDRDLQARLARLEARELDAAGLQELGRLLAALLLPPGAAAGVTPVRELLQRSLARIGADAGLRLRLRLPAALAGIPWEYVYVDRAGGAGMDGFLALDPRTAIVRHEVLDAPATTPALEGDLRVLAVFADAAGLPGLDLDAEQRFLREALEGVAGVAVESCRDPNLDSLLPRLAGARVFHFAGHGDFRREMGERPGTYTGTGFLALGAERVGAEQVGLNLRGQGVRLAVLSGCSTGRRDGVSVWSGIAPALVKVGIPAVVANQYRIQDRCAIAFGRQFYQALAAGLPVERAVAAGRVGAYNADRTGRDWGVPVLYLRAGDGALFAGAADARARARNQAAAEAQVQLRIGEIRAGGVVCGAELERILDSTLGVAITVAGEVRGRLVGIQADEVAASVSARLDVGSVGDGGIVIGLRGGVLGAASGRARPDSSASGVAGPDAVPAPPAVNEPPGTRARPDPAPQADPSRPALDFDALISDRTQRFTGRQWVFEAIGRWLAAPGDSRVFLLTGDPGTGKTAIASRIVQLHRGDSAAGTVPGLPAGVLSAYHFCQASSTDTVSPLAFVASLAQSLANRHPEYRSWLEGQGATQYRIEPVVHVHGDVAPGGTAIGGQFNVTVEVRSGDAGPLFEKMLRLPLCALHAAGHREPVTILVDSLDEALWFDPDSNIARLLQSARDFPPQVRFLLTCRTGNTRVLDLLGPPALDLIADAPPGLDEVRDYARARLATLPAGAALAERVARQSRGNFLYAHHVLRELEGGGLAAQGADLLELPDSLEEVYRQSIRRGLAARPTLWQEAYRPVLGLIAVARGDGLPRSRLIEVTRLPEDRADQVLDACRQYLVGGEGDRPYRIYHQSFRDFLLQDKEYGVVAHERHAALARFLEDRFGGSWASCTDDYALRYTPLHWAEAARLSALHREERVRALVELLGRPAYRRRFERRVRDLGELQADLRRAVVAAATLERAEALPWLVRAANGYVGFRHEFLQGQSVVKLAEAGELELADARLGLYAEIDADWRQAARLILAWQGAAARPDAAVRLREQARPAAGADAALACLDTRLAAELGLAPDVAVPDLPRHSLAVAQAIVQRIGGQEFDRELLRSLDAGGPLGPEMEMLGGEDYAARTDAPCLVAAARDFGPDGTALLDRYVDAHAGYQYVEYRNRSLWFVLDAVLHLHPDRAWVRERLARLLATALAGGGQDYREVLPLTAALLQRRSAGDLTTALDAYCGEAFAEAGRLRPQRGVDDSWGAHRRRLTALYELAILVAEDAGRADRLLERVQALPGGFAGFQAPALLRQADALVATGRAAAPARARSLDDALQAAHHVQDFRFCARVTARCNALRRWHATPLGGTALAATIERLAAAPADPGFAADHRVHEPYQHRNHGAPGTLPVEPAMRAETLEQLADLFQRPVLGFRRVNPAFELQQTIPDGTSVRVPDPGFVPLLAVHLAARCLADPALEDERPRLIRSLVPVALDSATALDTVLGYLLVAVQPDSDALLDELVAQAGPVTYADAPARRPGGVPG